MIQTGLRGDLLAALLAWGCSAYRAPGRVDADVVADVFGVSPQTVRRWVRSGLPKSRIEALAERVQFLDSEVLDRQRLQHEEAVRVAKEFHLGRMAPTRGWSRQGWTKPHRIDIIELQARGHLQVARISRVADPQDRIERNRYRYGGVLVDSCVFPSRFVAAVAKFELLEAVSDWRIDATSVIDRNGTEVWLAGAPCPDLNRLKRSLAARGMGKPRPLKARRRGR